MPKSSASPQARHRPRSIVVYLFALALIGLVPAVVFSGVLLQRNNAAQDTLVETLIVGTSRSIMQAVERDLVAKVATLKVLAASEPLLDGDVGAAEH